MKPAWPLAEPVVQFGPFVMNTHEEIEQALRDCRDGVLADAAASRAAAVRPLTVWS